jgi:hypothetical protein
MNSQQLIDVGWRLARPCLLLNEAALDEPIVWTFRDAEPWIEVLLSPKGQFEMRERIS